MKAILAFLVGVMGLGATTLAVGAEEKKCKPGHVYDDAPGKCVTSRGS